MAKLNKSLKIIEDSLYDIMADDTVRKEFNDAFNSTPKGLYYDVDEMFEVAVHNALSKLFKEFTMEDKITEMKESKKMNIADFNSLCHRILDEWAVFSCHEDKKTKELVLRIACEEDEANNIAKTLEKEGFITDVRLITDKYDSWRGCYDIYCI